MENLGEKKTSISGTCSLAVYRRNIENFLDNCEMRFRCLFSEDLLKMLMI